MSISNADLAVSKRKYLSANGIPSYVGVDERFPLGTIECYTLPRVKFNCSLVTVNIPFYITFSELRKLEDRNGKGSVYGRTEWGPYCKLMCEFYRVKFVIKLSDEEQATVQKSIYEEE